MVCETGKNVPEAYVECEVTLDVFCEAPEVTIPELELDDEPDEAVADRPTSVWRNLQQVSHCQGHNLRIVFPADEQTLVKADMAASVLLPHMFWIWASTFDASAPQTTVRLEGTGSVLQHTLAPAFRSMRNNILDGGQETGR